MDGKIKLGSVCFAGMPFDVESCYQHPEGLAIGDIVPGKEISWIRDGDRLIADRAVCYGMSWKELNEMGLIFGKLIFIDGNPYICRSLRVGTPETVPNEWDDLLNRHGEDDELWHFDPLVGFRPALEPLGSKAIVPGALVEKIVKVYGPRGMVITGRLGMFLSLPFLLLSTPKLKSFAIITTRKSTS